MRGQTSYLPFSFTMAIATITWPYVPGSLSTTVRYKLSTSSTWIYPTSPANPTTLNTYPLTIMSNTYYDVMLTTNGVACASGSVTFPIISGTTSTTTTSTTTLLFGVFGATILYDMTVTSMVGSIGIPPLTYPIVAPETTNVDYPGTIPAQTITLVITGTPPTTLKLDLAINAAVVDCVAIPSAGTYNLIFPGCSAPANVLISIDSGVC